MICLYYCTLSSLIFEINWTILKEFIFNFLEEKKILFDELVSWNSRIRAFYRVQFWKVKVDYTEEISFLLTDEHTDRQTNINIQQNRQSDILMYTDRHKTLNIQLNFLKVKYF